MSIERDKLAVVCLCMPPTVGGSGILINNLLREYPGEVEAISGAEYGSKIDPAFRPPWKTHCLRFWPPLLQRAVDHLSRVHYFLAQRFIYSRLKMIRPAVVLAACPEGLYFAAAFVACRKLRIPFWGHMHDLWLENLNRDPFKRSVALYWEPIIFREAKRIFCMTEMQRDYYGAKYDREFDILPHCVPGETVVPDRMTVRTKPPGAEILVLYTGSTSQGMNLDALKGFVACIDNLPANYKIKMLTAADAEGCRRLGIYHDRIEYAWVSVAESRRLVRECDVLFLPLSFKNCRADEVRTVFATKTLDYLVSGIPILAYSPPDSFHSTSARANGWAHVVDEDNPELLARGIRELAENSAIRQRVVDCALQEARRRAPRPWAKKLEGYFAKDRMCR
jgi:glycosyltransferase involved in cell wall biosynthesis